MSVLDRAPSIAIVSGFGRGHWLAVELRQLGFEVNLIDISESLGRWAPEDWEGPLGYFQTDELMPSQRGRLDEEDYSEAIEEGFVLWLKNGPVDLRGSHSSYLLEKREVPLEVQEYVSGYDKVNAKRRLTLKKKIAEMPFHLNWFAGFAHALGSPMYLAGRDALNEGRPLPLFAPYAVRRVSRRGAEKSLAWMRQHGVTVHANAKVSDISLDRQKFLSVEVESERSGVLKADHFIWALSSLETARLNTRFATDLFLGGVLTPAWVWMRYRIEFENTDLAEVLPLKAALIEDLALPWTHSNLQLLQRTASAGRYDVWVRLPEVNRFQKSYIEEVGAEIAEILRVRLPGSTTKIVEWPQEYHYDEATLGPARFGVYAPEQLAGLKASRRSNLYFHGPEFCETLDWNGQFDHQKKVYEKLRIWKTDLDRKIEKMKARAKEKAP